MTPIMSILAEIMAKLGGDLASPRAVDNIDRVLVHLLSLRKMAADLHGVSAPAPVMLAAERYYLGAAIEETPVKDSQPQSADRNISTLIHLYRSDPRSPYHQIRSKTRENYNSLIRRILKDCGEAKARDLTKEDLERYHERWKEGGHIPMAHSLMTMLRQIVHFNATVINDADCLRLSVVLHRMKFENSPPRAQSDRIIEAHVLAVRSQAHKQGAHMLAFAQALQWDGKLAQKDVIGEWVPHNESAPVTGVFDGDQKWVRGISWNQIDENLVLRHVTSARDEKIEVDLNRCPMVLEELRLMFGLKPHEAVTRDRLPLTGPIIINEETGVPYLTHKFRRTWRKIARAAGVPDEVENRDSRMAKGKRSGWQKLVEKQSAL